MISEIVIVFAVVWGLVAVVEAMIARHKKGRPVDPAVVAFPLILILAVIASSLLSRI